MPGAQTPKPGAAQAPPVLVLVPRLRGRLAQRLVLATVVPMVLGFVSFGVLAQRKALELLEDELGRRLAAAAVALSLQILPEQVAALGAGEEGSRTFANVHGKLVTGQERFDLRRVMVLASDLTGRGDSDGRLALGARAHEVSADEVEIQQARNGRPAASPLFTGKDGRPYKRAYAAIGDVGVVMVEGDATFYDSLVGFRRWMLLGGTGVVALLIVAIVVMARTITGPVQRLALSAERIGRGQLDAPVIRETSDEIGGLAERLEQMRQALAARDERMQMMLAGIAHEVRNPLGGLELFAGLLREGLEGQPERLEEVKRLEREVAYLNAVVTQFLDYARRPPLCIEPFDVPSLLREVAEVGAPSRSDVKLAGEGTLTLQADRGQLRRVLLNLLHNAVAAAPEGPIVLDACQREQVVVIECRDGGPGVPKDLAEKIFTPFFTTRQQGTGLGLAFAKEIVAEHGGELTLHPAPEGGACFRIELPQRC